MLLHLPAIAFSAGCKIPTMDDWNRINLEVPRIVSVNPNGPIPHPTVRAFLSGGVPEAMLKLRRLNILHEDVMTVTGMTLGENLDCFEDSERRYALKRHLKEEDGVDADDVIMDIDKAKACGLTSTITFPKGNIAPEGAVIKSTAIDKSVIDSDGVYRAKGPIKVFVSEEEAMLLTGARDRITAGRMLAESTILTVMTLGAEGCLLFRPGKTEESLPVPPFPVSAVDTTGAGDAFWGAFLFFLGETLRRTVSPDGKAPVPAENVRSLCAGQIAELPEAELRRIAVLANAAGALCTTKKGAIPALPSRRAVEQLAAGVPAL